ncbi:MULTISPECIES: HIT domain-containing protein [unclassified Brevundimonas]|uniref:HIT domain-containing protein n=1 Tax=unclassified Brevundimonas TaxID=2622653 RepID=UPI0006F4F505|nr:MULTISPECIES: HIT domain-containing protein [unclassified Brevundimonas]KQY80098.1 diadenosine tetraphosphate hydrolase [Brevundimonas sp. Root1423]KRA28320.1 diadenosine tetraphosphate hydrolase [Brevundimonas sp. Root608]
MADAFKADPAFNAGSVVVCDWPLCEVRLQDDARFPWLILIPRRTGLHELEDLTATERAELMDEIVRAGDLARLLGEAAGQPVEKLNVAALGNVTTQLHVHVVGRRSDDGLWPDPVWGRGAARPYGANGLQAAVSRIRLRARPPVK